MTLNNTAIDWCSKSWNPVTGCNHGCRFCYARRIATRFAGTKAFPKGFAPTFHPDRLEDPVKMKKPQVIFVCSMADLFGLWVPMEWEEAVIAACDAAPWHTYIFLTKNPSRYFGLFHSSSRMPVRKNWWLGYSVGQDAGSWSNWDLISVAEKGWNTFLSVEPLIEESWYHSQGEGEKALHPGLGWMIIGMQTGPLTPCSRKVLDNVIQSAKTRKIPIFMKDSVQQCFPDIEMLRQFPWNVLSQELLQQ